MRLAALKEMPINLEHLSKFDNAKIIEAMTLWPLAYVGWEKPTEEEPEDLSSWFMWKWDGVMVDDEMLYLNLGTNSKDLIKRLIFANVIYPDGTYNSEAIAHLPKEE